MEAEIRERTDAYISARHHHPAWHLLAARRAPLILSCLQTLFEQSQDGVGFDDALRALAEMLADHANAGEFEIGEEDFAAQARKELRSWIKLSLVVEREGRVFHAFHQQLGHSIELDNMKQRLRTILRHPATQSALTRVQQVELRWLIMRLVKESAAVIQARARSERDVKGFLKTGLAAEHHRVGALLNDIFQQALDMDWGSQSLRRKAGPFPPVAIANGALPVVERLLFKSLDQDGQRDLELQRQPVHRAAGCALPDRSDFDIAAV